VQGDQVHEQFVQRWPGRVVPVVVQRDNAVQAGPGGVTFDVLGFSRTARRLMEGTAYYPSDASATVASG